MKLSEFLKEFRLKKNMTQIKMAAVIGITQTSYSFIESGKTIPSFATIDKIAEVTGKTVEQLRKML